MKNYSLGLGMFALVFSLNLIFSGILEAKPALQPSYFQLAGEEPQAIASEVNFNTIQDGILQHKTELSELHHVVRKFPAALGLLFLLLNQNIEESASLLHSNNFLFPSLTRDFPVSYRSLRI